MKVLVAAGFVVLLVGCSGSGGRSGSGGAGGSARGGDAGAGGGKTGGGGDAIGGVGGGGPALGGNGGAGVNAGRAGSGDAGGTGDDGGNAGRGGSAGTGGTAGKSGSGGDAGRGGSAGHGGSAAAGGNGGGMSAGDTAGRCGADRLTAAQATDLYKRYAFEVQPGLNPTTIFEATELDVAGLWEGLSSQLFYVSGKGEDGSFFRDCTILTHACQILVPAGECSQFVSALASGVIANGAFYFSWGSGSGVFRSQLGKLVPNGAQFIRTVSPEYVNANSGWPPLVLRVSGADILVHRATSSVFNGSASPDQVGKVKDLGDALVVVDDSGRAIPNMLPP